MPSELCARCGAALRPPIPARCPLCEGPPQLAGRYALLEVLGRSAERTTYRARRLEDLAQIFGEALSQGLSEQRPGTWARYESRYGVHLVRLDEVHAASGAALESVRADVHRAWVEEQRAALLEARIAELRARWSVVER